MSVPIPVDSETVSTTNETAKRVQTNLTKCLNNNDLTVTFSNDHHLGKLNSENVRVLSCMSPIGRVGLPYIQKYLKRSHICEKNFVYTVMRWYALSRLCCRRFEEGDHTCRLT